MSHDGFECIYNILVPLLSSNVIYFENVPDNYISISSFEFGFRIEYYERIIGRL